MILPIIAYGDPVLKEVGEDIEKDYPKLKELIADMYETMYNANGIGLAAPQVGLSIRLFIIDTAQLQEEDEKMKNGVKKVLINATIIEDHGQEKSFEEGCLSIPGIRENVVRPNGITIEYYDENFEFHKESYTGINARVIQHEYDHVEGVLFTDYLKPLKKRMLKRKLMGISKGEVDVPYKMKFPVMAR